MNRKISLILLLLAVIALAGVPQASAFSTYKTWFETNYSSAVNSRIDACLLCHMNPDPNTQGTARNPYGTDFGNNSHNFTAIETFNSDGDGFINIDEINNLTFPGNSSDFPPVITSFTPASPVMDAEGASRTFTVTVNQPLNVIWLINGAQVQNTPTTGANNQSTYINTSAAQGTWNVSAIAQKAGDGIAMQTWTWNVGAAPTPAGTFNISGFKINNATGSGVQGWNITLNNITMQTSMLTGADGSYKFTDLVNGTYNVTEELQAEWTNVSPISQQVTITGADMMNINFTNQPPAAATFNISGFKINDTNGNGVWDSGEMGIENWNIMLLNDTGVQLANTSTNAQGFYQFMNIFPGNYSVAEEMKPGFNSTNATSMPVTVENMDVTNVNFTNALVVPSQATFNISGFKIKGTNGNGMGIENWNIMLLNPDTGAEIANTTTDSMGFYNFMNLVNGTYNVTEGMMTGWMNISATSQIINISGADVIGVNFTNALVVPPQATFNISGFKINDTNGNGVWDSGEMGMENWNIMLLNDTGVQLANTSTNAQGFYQFMNIFPGKYNIAEEVKPGFTPTNATSMPVTVENMDIMNVNFTNTPVAVKNGSISGFKINVANATGLQGWTIKLIGIVDNGTGTRVIRMDTTTNAEGFYMFNNLPAGRYILREELQRGFVPAGPPVKNIMLSLGENSMNNNFTNRPIRGLVGKEDHKDKRDHKDKEDNTDAEDDRDTE